MKIATKTYLTLEGCGSEKRATLWDTPRTGAQELLVVEFADGTYGLLPEKQAVALQQIHEQFIEEEEKDLEQNGGDWDENDVLDPNLHIVHSLRAIETKD